MKDSNQIDRERTKSVLQGILTDKDDRKEKVESRSSKDQAGAMNSEELDPIVDTLESGVFTYISSILGDLYKSNHVCSI